MGIHKSNPPNARTKHFSNIPLSGFPALAWRVLDSPFAFGTARVSVCIGISFLPWTATELAPLLHFLAEPVLAPLPPPRCDTALRQFSCCFAYFFHVRKRNLTQGYCQYLVLPCPHMSARKRTKRKTSSKPRAVCQVEEETVPEQVPERGHWQPDLRRLVKEQGRLPSRPAHLTGGSWCLRDG